MGRDTDNLDVSPINHLGHVCVCPQTTTRMMMMIILVVDMFCNFVKKDLVYNYF